MKNFERIATGLDVAPLLKALEEAPELWREITLRQEYPGSAHHDTETIVVRGPKSFTFEDYFCDFSALNYPAAVLLDKIITSLVWPVLQTLQVTELGRMLIVKLKPRGVIDLHIDEGDYADHFSRFHICLQSENATLTVRNETQHFAPGEAWWLDHKALHYGNNDSDLPRIHIIFDAITPLYPMPNQTAFDNLKDKYRALEKKYEILLAKVNSQPMEASEEDQQKIVAQTLGMGKVFL